MVRERVGNSISQRIRRRDALPYSVVVHSYSDVSMRASLNQSGHEPGAVATVEARLTQFSMPLDVPAAVRMTVTAPDGSARDIVLVPVGDGRYRATCDLSQSGAHQVLVRATGSSLRGWPFTREQALSASVWHGADEVGGQGGAGGGPRNPDTCCELLACLLGVGLASPEIERRAREYGIEVERLRECLERHRAQSADPAGDG
jgi:hypothetical protein